MGKLDFNSTWLAYFAGRNEAVHPYGFAYLLLLSHSPPLAVFPGLTPSFSCIELPALFLLHSIQIRMTPPKRLHLGGFTLAMSQ